MSPTIIDIAKIAKTSKSTVSRYLNGGSVKNVTAKRIEEAIVKIDYKPNINARRLVLNKTNVIGVVLDDISNTYYSEVLSGIQKVVGNSDYTCTFYSRASQGKHEKDYLELFGGGHVDGLIMGTFQVRDSEDIEELSKSHRPVVFIGNNTENSNINSVDIDNKKGTIDSVNYLYELGHRKIAYLKGPEKMCGANLRAEGFIEGMKNLNLSVDKELIKNTVWTEEGGYKATKELIKSNKKFTSIVCSNLYCAYGAIKAIWDSGLKVPEDISVTGFDDGILAKYMKPSITTIKQPFFELGVKVSQKMLQLVNKPTKEKENILIEPKLMRRESTMAI